MGPIQRYPGNYEDSRKVDKALAEADFILLKPPGNAKGADLAALRESGLKLIDAPPGSKAEKDALADLQAFLAKYEDA